MGQIRTFDFTLLGGFPLSQDTLKHLQETYTEQFAALVSVLGDGSTPVKLSGMVATVDGFGVTEISDGYFYYLGKITKFTLSSFGAITLPDEACIVITQTDEAYTYYDASSQNASSYEVAEVQGVDPGTLTDPYFLFDDMISYGEALGVASREAWNTLAVSTLLADGNVVGDIEYKLDSLGKRVLVRSAGLTANVAGNLASAPGSQWYQMGVLSAAYRPQADVFFTVWYYTSGMFLDSTGVYPVKHLTGKIATDGKFYINWLKPDAAVSAYSVTLNFEYSLE